jgi:drug/metabolite transporter (DMT)-like permease
VTASRLSAKSKAQRRPAEADLGFSWGPVNGVLLGLGVAVLATGYVALAKGSTTLAPVLLVLGYLGLIPASIVLRGRNQGSGE